MASSDSDKSERGRLISEALEFNRSQPHQDRKQQPVGSDASASQNEVKAGHLLGGKYKVIEILGRGKAGVMYKVNIAFQPSIMYPRHAQMGMCLLSLTYPRL